MNSEGHMWIDIVHSKAKKTWYTLRVMGDSMSPEYLDGDIVLMDYALHPRDGDIVAALIDGFESILKIYSRKGDEITLTPIETKRHSPRMFHASRIAIQGVLVEIVRRVPKRKQ
jgi:repressor LexA